MTIQTWPVFALLYSASFWGIAWYPTRLLDAGGISGLWLALSSNMAALILFSAFYGFHQHGLREKPLGAAILLLAIGWANTGFLMALLTGEVVRVMILFYLSPLWAALLGVWLLGEPISRLTVWMLGLGLSGALITLWRQEVTHTAISTPDWLALTAGFAFALTNVMSRRLNHLSVPHKNQLAMAGTALISGVAIIGFNEPLPQANQMAWLGVIALGILGFLPAGLCTLYGFSRLPAQRSAVIMLFELVVGAISAWLLVGEAISGQVWMGGAMIILAGLIAVLAAEHRRLT